MIGPLSRLLEASGVPVTGLLVVDARPGEEPVIVVARFDGLLRSTDRGQSWVLVAGEPDLSHASPVLCLCMFPGVTGQRILAGTAGGELLLSADGLDWKTVVVPIAPAPALTTLVHSTELGEAALTWAGTAQDGVLLFSDPQGDWQAPNLGLTDLHVLCLLEASTVDGEVAIFAGVETGLFVSRTAGASWDSVPVPGGYDPVLTLAEPMPGVLWIGTEAGDLLAMSIAEGTWSRVGSNLLGGPINQILVVGECGSRRALVSSEGDLAAFTLDGGMLESLAVSPDASITALAALDSTTILVGLSSGAVLPIGISDHLATGQQ